MMSVRERNTNSKRTINSYFNKTNEENLTIEALPPPDITLPIIEQANPKCMRVEYKEFDITCLERDLGLRRPIREYPINDIDAVRRSYIQMGAYQKHLDEYPRRQFGKQLRRFQYTWFIQFPWLEYSLAKDKAYCFPCFLFTSKDSKLSTNQVFTIEGFFNWKRIGGDKCHFKAHVGGPCSQHNKAMKDWDSLTAPSQHIDKVLNVQSSQQVCENQLLFKTSIDAVTPLAKQACAFRGHDESITLSNRVNFMEKVRGFVNEDIDFRDSLENAKTNSVDHLRTFFHREHIMGDVGLTKGDKLILRGLKFHGFNGVKTEEQTSGQKFVIDVEAWMDLRNAGKTDCLSDTPSYTAIYRIVKEVVEGQPHNLLESVAELIASTTLTKYPQISAVRVKAGKPHDAIHDPFDHLGVEIIRYRRVDATN